MTRYLSVQLAALILCLVPFPTHAQTVGSGDIKKNAVHSEHIKKNTVKSSDIKNGGIKRRDLSDASVSTEKLKNKTVTEAKLAPAVAADIQMGAGGVNAVYDQNGVKIGNVVGVSVMGPPSKAGVIIKAKGYAGYSPSIASTYISFGAAFYKLNDCSDPPLGRYAIAYLTQDAVMTTHPLDGRVRIYVPKVDQMMKNQIYMAFKSCSATWDPLPESWMINCGSCTMSTGTADLIPLEEVFKIEDLVGPLVMK